MHNSSRSSPGIHSLDTDVLWFIFNINADIWDDYPLRTARLTSQVCGSWRNLMLASPGIWGKILKLKELQIEQDDSLWPDLVMKRTGTASLFFQGKLSQSRVEWFLGFISSYWGRICHLDTPSAGSDLNVLSKNTQFMDEPSQCVVFHLLSVGFNLEAPWIPNLRSISLSNPFSTTRILECLDHMPQLEYAKLSGWLPDSDIPNITTTLGESKNISLPRLTDLHIIHYYAFVVDIFQRITAGPSCSYAFYTVDDPAATTEQREIFSGYFQRQIDSLTEPRMQITVANDAISVELSGGSANPVYHHTHIVELSMIQESDIPTYMSLFYSGTSTTRITELDFIIKITEEDKHLKYTVDSITDFLSAFPSVTTLRLSLQSLSIFTEMSGVNEALFPSLKELILELYDTLTLPLQSQIINFLEQRRSYGRLIETLRVGVTSDPEQLNRQFLEGFDNMEVAFHLCSEMEGE